MKQENNIIDCKGPVHTSVVDDILEQLNHKLLQLNLELRTRKRIFSASTECLDNIQKHSEADDFNNPAYAATPSHFLIRQTTDGFQVETGNIMLKQNVRSLKKRLEQLNSKDRSGIDQLYKKTIVRNMKLSDKGGAGVGLIFIAKTTTEDLVYDFKTVDDRHVYFTLKIYIQSCNT